MKRFGGALVLGAGVSLAAVAFGSRPLGVVGVGLLLAAALTRAWVGLVRGPVSVEVVAEPSPATEGDDVTVEIRARRRGRIPVGSVVAHGSLGRLGSYSQALRGRGHVASGRLELWAVPRGVFPFSESRIALGDVLGLASVVVETEEPRRAGRAVPASWRSRACSPTPGGTVPAGAACSCADRPVSTSTRCASTSRASRSGACTGPRARVAGG